MHTDTAALTDVARPTRTGDPTVGFRRVAGAIALPLAFACQLVANTLFATSSMSGMGDTGPGEETLAFYRAFAGPMTLTATFAMLGALLAVPGLLAALRVLRPRRPRLGLWAVGLMSVGYICYFGIALTTFDTIALARLHPDAGDVLEATNANPVMIPVFLLFVVGNLGGTLLLGLAVILSRRVPWWAGVLIMGWTVGHLANILGGGEWFAVGGGVLEIVGLEMVAAAALRTPNAEWAASG